MTTFLALLVSLGCGVLLELAVLVVALVARLIDRRSTDAGLLRHVDLNSPLLRVWLEQSSVWTYVVTTIVHSFRADNKIFKQTPHMFLGKQ